MSYLNPLRLHFAGRFQAAVSTVNNDPTHYNNATFLPEYQQRQTATSANGWWNPAGDAAWRLIGCRVTSAWIGPGTAAGSTDPIVDCLIADSDQKTSAKLVDLDPEQQIVSEIWGMQVRICTKAGVTLLRSEFTPAAFYGIWDRCPTSGGTGLAGAMYQSVLTNLEWGDISQSPFLTALHSAATDGSLSIKFNVDGYDGNFQAPTFTLGRVAGTIGPYSGAEPLHFVNGRQFMTTGLPSGAFFAPKGRINFCSAVVNSDVGKIYVDLGNALPTNTPGGPVSYLGELSLVCEVQPPPPPAPPNQPIRWLNLGSVTDYRRRGWYEATAGVLELPTGRALTTDELAAISSNPLAILLPGPDSRPSVAIAEAPQGLYVRADQYVYRLNPGETAQVRVFATQLGQPLPGARILVTFDDSGLQGGGGNLQPATPMSAIGYPEVAIADGNGLASVTVTASDPGNPRQYIDGQVYGLRPVLELTTEAGMSYPTDPWAFVSFLIYSVFHPDEPPTWYGSMQPIFQQYANLYPVMAKFLDLGSYQSVCANRRLLLLAFGLDPANPNSMPATRDLSPARRKAILRWLTATGPDGNPLAGAPPPSPGGLESTPPAPPVFEDPAMREGKIAAAARRIGLQRRKP